MPYLDKYPKYNGINWPLNLTQKVNKCKYVFLSGKRINNKCNKLCYNNYCVTHDKLIEYRKSKKNNIKPILNPKTSQCLKIKYHCTLQGIKLVMDIIYKTYNNCNSLSINNWSKYSFIIPNKAKMDMVIPVLNPLKKIYH